MDSGDRSGWRPGPWDNEPDRAEFECFGLPCVAIRNPYGGWCGYVGVSPGHPWHGVGYGDVRADVHGGLTWADARMPDKLDDGEVWQLGFDCLHAGDFAPGLAALVANPQAALLAAATGDDPRGDVYRTLAWVRAEVERLAAQAVEAACPQ